MNTVSKKYLVLVATSLVLLSCKKAPEHNCCLPPPGASSALVGSWKLTAELIDPGNGSGTFQPVNSQKVIQIAGDSTFLANGDMCTMNSDTAGFQTGIFTSTDVLNLTSPCLVTLPITYEHIGDTLIISYMCFEGCRQKYVKL